MTNITRLVVQAAVAGGLAAALIVPAGPALAAPDNLDKHRAQVTERIDERLESLGRSARQVADAKHLTHRHKAALTALVSHERTLLTRLRARVAAERTNRGLRAAAADLVERRDAFSAVRPRIRAVIAADTDTATAASLMEVRGRFVGRVANATAAGANTRAAEGQLRTLRISVTRAQRLLAGKADAVIAAAPAAVERIARVITTAHEHIRQALTAARGVREFLEAHERRRG
ncbi:hypothetical protein [Luedemannella helvata]|uniref:Uncharacterized protein n=1 Tax=Luedemannella helvata TaxID=349315 RepID=A0ABN2K5E3_9ACTN